jgi:hypothetical protein
MKAIYQDFITQNPNCSGYAQNPDAKAVFDFLNQDSMIIRMAESADQGKPALAGCVLELEAFYDQMQNPMIDFSDDFTRTAVGRMVKTILAPFGYGVTKQKDFTKNSKGKYFKSASCYACTEHATMQIVKRVEPIV